MDNIEIILFTLTFIELCHLIIRMIKLLPERVPEIDKNILQTMYC